MKYSFTMNDKIYNFNFYKSDFSVQIVEAKINGDQLFFDWFLLDKFLINKELNSFHDGEYDRKIIKNLFNIEIIDRMFNLIKLVYGPLS